MLDPEIIQIIIQSGAVGLMLTTLFLGYKIANKLINVGSLLISNHLTHMTEVMEGVRSSLERLNNTIDSLLNRYK